MTKSGKTKRRAHNFAIRRTTNSILFSLFSKQELKHYLIQYNHLYILCYFLAQQATKETDVILASVSFVRRGYKPLFCTNMI